LVLDVKGIATRAGRLTPEKEPTSYQLRGGLSGLQSQSACCWEQKSKKLLQSRIKYRLSIHPCRNLVIAST